jgi:hypothetical protein
MVYRIDPESFLVELKLQVELNEALLTPWSHFLSERLLRKSVTDLRYIS